MQSQRWVSSVVCEREGTEVSIPTYRIHHILTVYIEQLKFNQINVSMKTSPSSTFYDEFILSPNGKKKQLVDQLISEAVVQLTTHVQELKDGKIAEDITHDIFPDDGGRKLYGTLI
jgi:hypothetical protein